MYLVCLYLSLVCVYLPGVYLPSVYLSVRLSGAYLLTSSVYVLDVSQCVRDEVRCRGIDVFARDFLVCVWVSGACYKDAEPQSERSEPCSVFTKYSWRSVRVR